MEPIKESPKVTEVTAYKAKFNPLAVLQTDGLDTNAKEASNDTPLVQTPAEIMTENE